MSTKKGHSRFRVGDRVRLPFGFQKVPGIILEDRGARGIGGRRLYQVEIPQDPFESATLQMAEDELEPAGVAPTSIEKSKLVEFLTYGGLVSILRAGMVKDKIQPRIWLCFDSLGNVTYTFVAERGIIGGEPIPPGGANGGKVYAPKRSDVVAYLGSFGLTRQEAESVVSEVGTAP